MQIYDSEKNYGMITRYLHWIVAIGMIGMIIFGFLFSNGLLEGLGKGVAYYWHKNMGLTLAIFILVRILWRFRNTLPPLDITLPNWQKRAARMNVYLLYLLTILFPVSGACMTLFRGVDVPVWGDLITISAFEKNMMLSGLFHDTHEISAYLILLSLAIHIGAAIHHHFILKNHILKRMLGTHSS